MQLTALDHPNNLQDFRLLVSNETYSWFHQSVGERSTVTGETGRFHWSDYLVALMHCDREVWETPSNSKTHGYLYMIQKRITSGNIILALRKVTWFIPRLMVKLVRQTTFFDLVSVMVLYDCASLITMEPINLWPKSSSAFPIFLRLQPNFNLAA